MWGKDPTMKLSHICAQNYVLINYHLKSSVQMASMCEGFYVRQLQVI